MEPLNIDQVEQEAFELGLDAGPIEPESLEHFEQTAEYANSILPELRRIAGYEDAGHGTYQIDREVEWTADDYGAVGEAKASQLMRHAMEGWNKGVAHGLEE